MILVIDIHNVIVRIHSSIVSKKKTRIDFLLGLTYELQLDKDKNPADQRLFFRESYRTIKKRHFKISNRICHDYSLYMKVISLYGHILLQ